MCGITGAIWTNPESSIGQDALRRMTDALRHRGPDEQGTYISDFKLRSPYDSMPGVALGHRRLSIIDVAGGVQPMSNEDQTIWLVFNGEIYNYRALRNRLEGAGHRFKSHSDTEVIIHLYEDEGVRCFEHLNGMFALAIWDARNRRLVLGRDRLGQKPLVYCQQADLLLFASELKSLLELPEVSRDIDPAALDEYLTYQYVPHPKTIFKGIRKLPPGHYAMFQDGKLHVEPYWSPDGRKEKSLSEKEYILQVRELLTSSVEQRMQSDVPLGAFLSGGMDSSIIVALMCQLSPGSIKTFSIGFPSPEYDESSYARKVAEHLGTDHYEFQVTPKGADILPQLVWHFDEPMADSSAIPTWYLSQWAREQVKVALTGDGGDELFAGYQRYMAVRLASRFDKLPASLRWVFTSRLWQHLPGATHQKSRLRLLKRFMEALKQDPVRRYLNWIEIFHESQRVSLYADDWIRNLSASDPIHFLEQAWSRASGRDDVTRAAFADLITYLPCDLMTKVDIASMAHSLECRQPFLDHRLVELSLQIPVSFKLRQQRGKRILWNSFRDLLPRVVGTRPKMGFGVPLGHWFRHELRDMVQDLLTDQTAQARGLFHPQAVQQFIKEHLEGTFDHGYRLWSLLVLELWLRRWCGSDALLPRR